MQPYRFWIYIIFVSVSLVGGAVRYKKLSPPFRILVYVLALTLISEFSAHYAAIWFHNNIIVYHIFTPIQFSLFCLLYNQLLESKSNKQYTIWAMVVFIVFSLINSFLIQTTKTFPTYSLLLESILIVSFAYLVFYELLKNPRFEYLLRSSVFWFNSAVIIFFTTSFIFWGLFNYLIKYNRPLLITLSLFLWLLNLLIYTLFIFSIFLDKKEE
jgi:hypothetical protein